MKIKHWQGYGCVTAKKIKSKTTNGVTTLVIKVSGNHECGLERDDMYDLFHWLMVRFDKDLKDVNFYEFARNNLTYNYVSDYEEIDGLSTDTCTYTFTYKK